MTKAVALERTVFTARQNTYYVIRNLNFGPIYWLVGSEHQVLLILRHCFDYNTSTVISPAIVMKTLALLARSPLLLSQLAILSLTDLVDTFYVINV